MSRRKKRIQIKQRSPYIAYLLCKCPGGFTHVGVEVYFKQSGRSEISGIAFPSGYYMSAAPCIVKPGMVRYSMHSGYQELLFEAERSTKDGIRQAINMAKQKECEVKARLGFRAAA